jgi:hypothetical protein
MEMQSSSRVLRARDRASQIAEARYEDAMAFKKKWHGWLYKHPPNIPLLMSNVLYLALCLTTLILTVLVLHEHANDFKRNSLSRFRDPSTAGSINTPKPCGLPTPDGMYLLQALGAVPGAGWDGATLEPNYQDWMNKINGALCNKLIPGAGAPNTPLGDDDQCFDYGEDFVEELLALGHLLDDEGVMPNSEDYADSAKMSNKKDLLENRACTTEHDDDADDPFYSTQQYDSYGDLKARVARAYTTAMPAFSRYDKERDSCQSSAQGHQDPFHSLCKHACHIKSELKAAATQQPSMYRTADADNLVPFTKQVYRLLALSLAGYYDRLYNRGECFRNGQTATIPTPLSAIEFCGEAMDESSSPLSGEQGLTQAEAFDRFAESSHAVKLAHECTDADNKPPPPAPPVYRIDTGNFPTAENSADNHIGRQVCAATLEYGLIEQGRLFGIPDVIDPFVVDNRVHRSAHFVAWVVYSWLYKDLEKDGGLTFADPKAKLELYIAYRLASSSIWAIMVANVAGFMMVRALVPMIVHVLKLLGVTTGLKDEHGEFKPIQLMRPQVGWLVWLTMGTTLQVVYWIMWLDPATQSHYYVSTTCEDWAGLGVQVPSGAYVTTWGKRRFDRFGEHLIGILLILTVFVLLFQHFIGRSFVDPEIKEAAKETKLGAVTRKGVVAGAMLAFALLIQLFFIIQSATSGGKWFDGAKGDDLSSRLGEVYTKDVLMSVWAAFWNAAAIGWYRQKWAVTDLKPMYQLAWSATCVGLVWMPVLQAAVLLDRELEIAFKNGKGSADTERLALFICIVGFTTIWTLLLAFRLREVYYGVPDTDGESAVTAEAVTNAKEDAKVVLKNVEEARPDATVVPLALIPEDYIPSEKSFRFDLSGVQIAPGRAPARMGAPARFSAASGARFALRDDKKSVYMPLLPR